MASEYKWASGFGVALGSLVPIDTDIASFMGNVPIVIATQPVERYPVRRGMLDGSENGGGRIDHTLVIRRLTREAMNYIEDTYLTTTGVIQPSKAMTIRLRNHDQDTYTRYNCYICLPKYDDRDLYELGEFVDVEFTLRKLVPL